jgi:dienelactone hydrolase
LPAVVIIPDWDGEWSTRRSATMLAELGYVAFAADIVGTYRFDAAACMQTQ